MPSKSFVPRFAEELSKRGFRKVLPAIRSNQLRRGLVRVLNADGSWALHIPHYWAVYLHDGRNPVSRKGGYLVWFRNPNDDPRLSGGRSPERLSQVRKLSKGNFQKWAAVNRRIIKAYRQRTGKRVLTSSDYESMKLPMIVAKLSPRSGYYVPGNPFFSNGPNGGMHGFRQEADGVADSMTSRYVMDRLKREGLLNAKRTVKIRI